MSRQDAYRVGIRLLGLYFAAQGILGLGYAFSAYLSAAMMSTASSESVMMTLKTLPSNFIYPVACAVAAFLLLSRAGAIVNAFEKADRKADGESGHAG